MEIIKSINPARVLRCCSEVGISTDELARACTISENRMNDFLSGDDVFTFKQIKSIAEYFGRGILFFLDTSELFHDDLHSPQFRSLQNQKPELGPKLRLLIERVERHRDFFIGLQDELDEFDFPKFTPPEFTSATIKDQALKARAWLQVGLKNSFDSYRTAIEARGVLVFRSNGYNGKWQISKNNPVLGFAIYDPVCPVIVVKKQDFESRQTFTLIHELGHLLLHRQSSIDDQNDFESTQEGEREANEFAGYFLVPDVVLATINDELRPSQVSEFDNWLASFRRDWGVSSEVILRRLLGASRLSSELYTEYRAWASAYVPKAEDGGSRLYRHREPIHIFGHRYVRTVLDSLEANNITLARASTYLDGIKIKDLRQLEGHYAGV